MEKFNDIDDFLAKWASGDLSEKDKEAFRKMDEYQLYAAILEGTDRLDVPAYDKEKTYTDLQAKIKSEGKVVRLVPKWAYAMAASVALLIGYVFFFNQTIKHETGYGEKMAVLLPDSSEVILNAKSKLKYSKQDWEKERTLVLDGEAFFKVTKGSTFTVSSKNGKVTVLGTQFTMNTEKNIFEVICYEGRVRVDKSGTQRILSKGQGVRAMGTTLEDFNLEQSSPSWMLDETTFQNAPIQQVVRALEKQYGITIHLNKIDTTQRYTGSFTHNNLETALRTVFESLEIKFTFKDKKTIDLVQG